MNSEYYRGYTIQFNPITTKYYFYTGDNTWDSQRRVFNTFEEAQEAIDRINKIINK